MKKVLVTGGKGFIGSHLVEELIKRKCEIIVIDNESSECNSVFYRFDGPIYYCIDISNYESICDLFKGVDTVFHLAASSRIQPTIGDPLLSVRNNVLGTASVLEACRKYKVKKIVYSASSSFYGLNNKTPQRESMTGDCLNPYSLTKFQGEELCKMYSNLCGISATALRYFNVYGPREPLMGEYAPVIGLFKRLRDTGKEITIVGDGEQRRDFTYVKDVVRANLLAAENYLPFEVYNVGSGKNYSINEIAELVDEKAVKKHLPERFGEARETLADITKIKNRLGWIPKYSLKKMINSYG